MLLGGIGVSYEVLWDVVFMKPIFGGWGIEMIGMIGEYRAMRDKVRRFY